MSILTYIAGWPLLAALALVVVPPAVERIALLDVDETAPSKCFDVFLSHVWAGEAASIAASAQGMLLKAGVRVWIGTEQMGRAAFAGVASSATFVALVSRDYAVSSLCMSELRLAESLGKSIVAVVVEPDTAWRPAVGSAASDAERKLAVILNASARTATLADLVNLVAPQAHAAVRKLSWSTLMPDTATPPFHGGMGTVFKAHWARRGTDVAVKLLRASELSAADYVVAAARLEREAEALQLASADGANRFVVPLFGIARGATTAAWRARLGHELALFERSSAGSGAENGKPAELFGLVMAWQDPGTLAEHLHGAGRAAWLAKRTAARLPLLERIANGVTLMHSAQPHAVVHGDIKSANVLLTSEGEPRLSDFGLARIRHAEASEEFGAKAGGTWPYMAPELYPVSSTSPAGAASRATDVYALATLCWEVLTAERPWATSTEASRVSVLRAGGNLDWRRLPGDAPTELVKLLKRCTALDPVRRPSALQIFAGLSAARQRLAGTAHLLDGAAAAAQSPAPV